MKRFLCVGKSSRVRVHMYQKEEATLVRSIELESIVELVVSHADNACQTCQKMDHECRDRSQSMCVYVARAMSCTWPQKHALKCL